ncbi:MAG: hypothetical protein IKU46_06495 [Peptococcaceae bacterium]|nr:hypothetical protein [Peptococcaceae bacterium]
MLHNMFLQILNMSFVAVPMIIGVMIFRLFANRIPRKFVCILWAVILFRLLCPVTIDSEWSGVMEPYPIDAPVMNQSMTVTAASTEPLPTGGVLPDNKQNPVQSGESISAEPIQHDWLQTLVFVAGPYLWVTGLLVLAVYSVVSMILLKRRLTGAVKLRDNIYLADHLASSFVTGVLSPKIYISSQLSIEERRYVILHEQMHIRRGDHLIKLLAWLALCIHWFNPLVWGMFQFFGDDIEMACDEAVLRNAAADIRADYAGLLLRITAGRSLPVGTPLAFGEGDIKARISNIMRYEKPTKIVLLLAMIAVLMLAISFGTNPVQKNTELLGANYHAREILYATESGGFADAAGTNGGLERCAGAYSFTTDDYLYDCYGAEPVWNELGCVEDYPLTKKELFSYCMEEDGWRSRYTMGEITDAAILRMNDGSQKFYLLMQTRKGETLLGYGWEDVNERGQDASDDTSLYWLIQLESVFDPDGVQVNYFMRSLRHIVNDSVDTFAFWENSKYTPGYLIVGFLADGSGEQSDMGYATFRWVGNCLKMLDCHVYPDAAITGTGIYRAEHPAVLSDDGTLTDAVTYDVILSNNDNLDSVVRVVTYADGSQKELRTQAFGAPELITFRWADENSFIQNFDSETRVSQYFYDKEGNIIPDERVMTIHFDESAFE